MKGNMSEKTKERIALLVLLLISIISFIWALLIGRTSFQKGNYSDHKCKGYHCSNPATWRLKSAGILYFYCDEHFEDGAEEYKVLTGTSASGNRNSNIDKASPVLAGIVASITAIPAVIFFFRSLEEDREIALREYATLIPPNSLYLQKRGLALAEAIRIVDDKHYTISHKPDEYIYTGATVGGISMGGIEKIDGYDYVSNVKKTGKCQIQYLGEIIKTISLSADLYNKAKNSKIAKYLNDKKQIVIISTVISPAAQLLASSGRLDMAKNMMDIDSSRGYGYPSYEKCVEILDWIYGID